MLHVQLYYKSYLTLELSRYNSGHPSRVEAQGNVENTVLLGCLEQLHLLFEKSSDEQVSCSLIHPNPLKNIFVHLAKSLEEGLVLQVAT